MPQVHLLDYRVDSTYLQMDIIELLEYISWKDNPLPTFVTASDKCYYSHEMTAIVRVGKALGKDIHQSFAFKLNSRPDVPDDTQRSTIEFCMPNDQKSDSYVNYNFAHAGYSKVTGLKQYLKEGKITPGQWIGVKHVFIIADDSKSSWMGLYVNSNQSMMMALQIMTNGSLNLNTLPKEYQSITTSLQYGEEIVTCVLMAMNT